MKIQRDIGKLIKEGHCVNDVCLSILQKLSVQLSTYKSAELGVAQKMGNPVHLDGW